MKFEKVHYPEQKKKFSKSLSFFRQSRRLELKRSKGTNFTKTMEELYNTHN